MQDPLAFVIAIAHMRKNRTIKRYHNYIWTGEIASQALESMARQPEAWILSVLLCLSV